MNHILNKYWTVNSATRNSIDIAIKATEVGAASSDIDYSLSDHLDTDTAQDQPGPPHAAFVKGTKFLMTPFKIYATFIDY